MFTYLRKDQKFSEARAKIYCAEIIEAIDCLHKRNIVYRDLKPENVLLDSDGHIRITDFGLSKQNITARDKTFSFCGTPEYLAPEINAGFGGYDYRVDIWSLGCCLYEIVAGDPPFRGPQDAHTKDVVYKDYFSTPFKDLLEGLL